MRTFVKVVEAGSFTVAAQNLDTTTAQTSRSVADLEAHLRTRLLHRTTRKIALTEAGERYLDRCRRILQDVEEAEAEARDAQMNPSGKLRVHSMTSFGIHHVVPLIAGYTKKYPSVSVDLTLLQRVPDLLEEGFDVSLILARDLPDSNNISQKLGSSYSVACAAPAYLAARVEPKAVPALDEHVCLQLETPAGSSDTWLFEGPNGEEKYRLKDNVFRVNIPEALAAGVRAGMGIGVLPSSAIAGDLASGSLVRVLGQYRLDDLDIFAVYPSRQYLDAKVRTWLEFLRETLPGALAADALAVGERQED